MSAIIETTQAFVPCPECGADLADFGLAVYSKAITVQAKHLNFDGMGGDYDSFDADAFETVAVRCGACDKLLPNEYETYEFEGGVYGQAPEIAPPDPQVEALRASDV